MRRIVVINSVTLDGVMQAPARPDEDTRDGFGHGGWAVPYQDHVLAGYMAERMEVPGSMLFGRRTYEDLRGTWAGRTDNPYSPVLDNGEKYVVSRTLPDPLPWRNSVRVDGDVPRAVARLKEGPGGDIAVLGSGELHHTLRAHGLVDEYVLVIHPLVLGTGRRLFPDGGTYGALRLVDSVATTTGVVIGTYHPVTAGSR
ncbi:MAG TPA: dihydrofolate reductase family protein [Streptosporangiales bacterium]